MQDIGAAFDEAMFDGPNGKVMSRIHETLKRIVGQYNPAARKIADYIPPSELLRIVREGRADELQTQAELSENLACDPDWSVRLEVARLLHLLDDEACSRLAAVFRQDANSYVRSHAERGLARQRKARRSSRGTLEATVNVTNTGQCAGDEVVQCYIRDEVASICPFEKQLRAFQRLRLEPGQSREVSFTLGPDELWMIDAQMRKVVEPGWFTVQIGGSSDNGTISRFLVTENDKAGNFETAEAINMRPEDDAEAPLQ